MCPSAEALYDHTEEFDAVLVVTPHKTHPVSYTHLVGVGHHIAQDLLLVQRGVDATDDGNIHLDEPGCKLQ